MPAPKRKPPKTDAPPAAPRRGRGRPPKLTRDMLEAIDLGIRTGAPIVQVCQSEGINRDSYYEWKERGAVDREAGRRSLYAEFSDRVRIAEAKGEIGYWASVALGVKTGKAPHVAAGKLALAALRTRWGKRYSQEPSRRGAAGATPPGEEPPAPTSSAPAPDLSKLSADELAQFRQLLRKARGGG
jgi:hypothetical protein